MSRQVKPKHQTLNLQTLDPKDPRFKPQSPKLIDPRL